MHFGVVTPNTEYGIRPEILAREAGARGFESIWVPEHTHIPVSRQSPFPLGGDLPEEYKHFMDPFVSLTAAAMTTNTIKLATGICLVIEHDPIVVAKAAATLDFLSNGRFIFGVGAGWNKEEMANHGTDFGKRWKIFYERMEAITQMWTEEQASYHGEHVDFDPIWIYPKPVQKPHPPVYFGALTKTGIRRVVRDFEGWLLVDPQDGSVEKATQEFHRACEELHRDRKSISVTIFSTSAITRELLDRYAAADVDRVVAWTPPDDEAGSLKIIDSVSELIPDYR